MDGLDIFALVVLVVLLVVIIVVWLLLGIMPGRIAQQRNHPQADAINICGWWGIITMGLLLPVAWIWAYTNSEFTLKGYKKPIRDSKEGES